MTLPVTVEFAAAAFEPLAAAEGRVALLLPPDGRLDAHARRLDRAVRGAVARAVGSKAWEKLKPGEAMELAWPAGLKAEVIQIVKLPARAAVTEARKAGAAMARALGEAGAVVLAGGHRQVAEIALGLTLRAYDFGRYRTGEAAPKPKGPVTILVADPEAARAAMAPVASVAEGVCFTRDLVSEPANVLTTTEFAARLSEMKNLGLKVEVLEEKDLDKLGMRALLGVGQGSESPSKVVVMEWQGVGKGDAPFAFVGKGVCFDSGGLRRRPDACARRPQGEGQRHRRHRPRGKHARRRRPAAGRHRALHVRPDHRDWCWPTCSGTCRTSTSRASWSIWRR